MLKQGVKNVICMNGVKLPETIKDLSRQKEVTLFVDGDRGGKLIIKNVTENANVNYIAVAPEGKEVEELTGKEILQSLRKRLPVSEFLGKEMRFIKEEPVKEKIKTEKLTEEQKEKIKKALGEFVGTKGAIVFDKEMNIIRKMPISRLLYYRAEGAPYVLAINDTALPNIIRAAESLGVSHLAANNFTTTDTNLNLVSI